MNTCRACGSRVTGNFCTNCGASVMPTSVSYCPRCNNAIAPSMAFCSSCGTALRGPQYAPQTAYPVQPQNNVGKYLMGALGGAAAVLGGEMLLHDVEKDFRRPFGWDDERRPWEEHHRHHHHHHRHRW